MDEAGYLYHSLLGGMTLSLGCDCVGMSFLGGIHPTMSYGLAIFSSPAAWKLVGSLSSFARVGVSPLAR